MKKKHLIILVLLLTSSKCKVNSVSTGPCDNYKSSRVGACEVLHFLAQNTPNIDYNCFKYLIKEITKESEIPNSMNCDFSGCYYFVRKPQKSLFNDDLLRWMKHFDCEDTLVVINQDTGSYTNSEIILIKNEIFPFKNQKKYREYIY